jgi:uncharacterized protein (TIGR00297 family)
MSTQGHDRTSEDEQARTGTDGPDTDEHGTGEAVQEVSASRPDADAAAVQPGDEAPAADQQTDEPTDEAVAEDGEQPEEAPLSATEKLGQRDPNFSFTLRKLLHLATALPILILPWIPWPLLIVLTGAWCGYNLFLLPKTKLGRKIIPEGEGLFSPARTYPMAIFSAALVFPTHILAGAWAVLAIGDATANLAGRWFGKRKLPWHARKTWVGSVVGLATSIVVAYLAIMFCLNQMQIEELPSGIDPATIWFSAMIIAVLGALAGMLVETIDAPFDDNFLVMQTAALGALVGHAYAVGADRVGSSPLGLVSGLGISLIFAILAYLLGAASAGASIVGALMAGAVYLTLGWKGFLLLALFVVLGVWATRVGFTRKEQRAAAEEHGGRRRVRHVVANLSVPVMLALVFFSLIASEPPLVLPARLLLVGYVAALATALADTMASEIGLLSKRKPFLITHWGRRVEHGTDGGITRLGLIAALIASLSLGVIAALVGLGQLQVDESVVKVFSWSSVPIVGVAGFLGNLVDSIMGATVQGKWRINNDVVNFIATLSGAAIAVLMQWWIIV